MRRVAVVAVVVATAVAFATVLASAAPAKLDLLFVDPASAGPGWVVAVRTRGTPAGFTNDERRPPFQTPLRLYLVPKQVAGEVRSQFDRRLSFIGVLVRDRSGRGVLTFAAPPLDTGQYAVAAWCRRCTYRPNFVVRLGGEGTSLHLTLPEATQTCPVTKGRYGNGFLSTTLPEDGVLSRPREPDGTLFDKLGWTPKRGFGGDLIVRGERIDQPGRLRVRAVSWGHVYVNGVQGRGSWRSAVVFPSEGCWRLTGRVRDVSLTYVVKVVAG